MLAVYFCTIERPGHWRKHSKTRQIRFSVSFVFAVLNVKWPHIATNDAVYAVTSKIPWSQVTKRRKLSWLGHLFCLLDDTPLKIALQYSLRQTKKPRSRQQTTCISMMKMKLLDMGLKWGAAIRLAKKRLAWNNFMQLVCPMGFWHANLVRKIN